MAFPSFVAGLNRHFLKRMFSGCGPKTRDAVRTYQLDILGTSVGANQNTNADVRLPISIAAAIRMDILAGIDRRISGVELRIYDDRV